MEITRKFKETGIDILVRVAQIIFVAFVVTPFVTHKYDLNLIVSGILVSTLCAFAALVISLTIKEVN